MLTVASLYCMYIYHHAIHVDGTLMGTLLKLWLIEVVLVVALRSAVVSSGMLRYCLVEFSVGGVMGIKTLLSLLKSPLSII